MNSWSYNAIELSSSVRLACSIAQWTLYKNARQESCFIALIKHQYYNDPLRHIHVTHIQPLLFQQPLRLVVFCPHAVCLRHVHVSFSAETAEQDE